MAAPLLGLFLTLYLALFYVALTRFVIRGRRSRSRQHPQM
jgi:hypothetical protein